jgi:hypothetical protein
MEARVPSSWGSFAVPFLTGSSIFTPFWIFLFLAALDLVKTSRSCSGLFSPGLFQKLEGRFLLRWLSKHLMTIARLCANGFRPCGQLLELEEEKYSFCKF